MELEKNGVKVHPSQDVRMKGFASRATVETALSWVDSMIPESNRLPTEVIPILEAHERVLATGFVSPVDVPSFARSMMDGYAIRADETIGATSYNSLSFQIIGTSSPGKPFAKSVLPGQAVRIMTGAPIPEGADAVLPVEFTELDGDRMSAAGEVTAGKHIGTIGEDVQMGSMVLEGGRLLRPQDIGLLSSMGCSEVPVLRKPTVRILVTGNELLPPGSPPHGYQIADANGPMLQALVARDGGLTTSNELIADDRRALLAALLEPADIVLVSGGSSVGQEDDAPILLAEHGTLAIHGLAMRPSSPTGMGRLDNKLVFLLPGNPVSCLCAYDFFAGRAIRAMSGRNKDWPYRRHRTKISRKLVSTIGRVDYARVRIIDNQADPIGIGGASILSSTTSADGFIIIPADSEGFMVHAEVDVWLYN